MSLVACGECGNQVSDQAKNCPHCGTPSFKKNLSSRKINWKLVGLASIVSVGAIGYIQSENRQKVAQQEAAKSPAQRAQEAKQRDAQRDQAALTAAAAKKIKSVMKDPDAFVLTSAFGGGNGAGCIEYRAKNSFGATFPGSAVAIKDGTILLEEKDKNRFVEAWNKHCQNGGVDLKSMVEVVANLK